MRWDLALGHGFARRLTFPPLSFSLFLSLLVCLSLSFIHSFPHILLLSSRCFPPRTPTIPCVLYTATRRALTLLFTSPPQARLRGESVIIHCAQGKSRSTAVAAAYVASFTNCAVAEALATIKDCRLMAQPNDAFVHQLERMDSDGVFHELAASLANLHSR